MSDLTTYRPTVIAAVGIVSFLVLTALAVIIGIALPAQNRFTPGQTFTIAVLLCFVLLAALLAARSRVTAGPDALVVVNGWREHTLEWSQIKLISMSAGAPWPTLVTVDDRRIILFAIQGSEGASARRSVAELAARLDESRQ